MIVTRKRQPEKKHGKQTGKPQITQMKTADYTDKTGQATLELALAIVCIFILLLGSLKIFLWVNQRLVLRQEHYESSSDYGRVKAGSSSEEVGLRESSSPYPKLNIFGK